MRTVNVPLETAAVVFNLDDQVPEQFGLEVDPVQTARLMQAIGVEETIDRRRQINDRVPNDMVVNFHNKSLGHIFDGIAVAGLAFAPRKKAWKGMPAADIQISTMRAADRRTVSGYVPPDSRDALQEQAFVEFAISSILERFLKHETQHFIDGLRDHLYDETLTKKHRKNIGKLTSEVEKAFAVRHPATVALQQELDKILPTAGPKRRAKLALSAVEELFYESQRQAMSKLMGIDIGPKQCSVKGLKRAVEFHRDYYMLPREIDARLAEKRHPEITGLFNISLTPREWDKFQRQPEGSLGWLALVGNARI